MEGTVEAPVSSRPAVRAAGLAARRPVVEPGRDVERVTAAVAVAALGVQKSVVDGVSVGVVVAVLLAPVWIRAFRSYRGGTVVVGLVALALANGALLTALRGSRLVFRPEAVGGASLLVQVGAGVGVLLWARTVLGNAAVAIWLGVGLTAWGVVNLDPGTNLWKYAVGMPLSVLLLGIAAYVDRTWVSVVALVALGGASLAFDARAFFAALVLCGVVYLWANLPGFSRSRNGWAGVVLMLVAVAGALYLLLSQLLVSGLLGSAAAERSQAQITESGSLILGGRPEIAATGALLEHRPVGFGFGVAPTQADVNAAKAGMAAINYDPNNGYVENYMFGGRIELHSVVGDLWATSGFAGLLVTAAIVGYSLFAVGRGVATRTGTAVVFFAAVWTLWNVPFSPLVGAVPVLVLLVGLTLDPVRAGDDDGRADPPGAATRPNPPTLGSLPPDENAPGDLPVSASSPGRSPGPVREEQ